MTTQRQTPKREVCFSPTTYESTFVPAKNGGLRASLVVGGRFVFADNRGPQPASNGQRYQWVIVGENPRQTVYFARILAPRSELPAPRLRILPNGRIVCENLRAIRPFAPAARRDDRLDEFRSATPNLPFIHEPEDYCSEWGDEAFEDERVYDPVALRRRVEARLVLFEEIHGVAQTLRSGPVSCHACGYQTCTCDGTGSDWLPHRTTRNLLA